MEAYTFPITIALCVFPFLAAAITLPYALYEYHKYGSMPWLRTLVVFSFVFYLLAMYFLIILPLPDRSNAAAFSFAGHFEPYPFNDLTEYVQKHGALVSLGAWVTFLKSPSFLQLAFNVLMTLPFGVYLRYYFKRSFRQTLLAGFVLSLFFELTQLSALYGFYPAPYRTFDTDDLICNTLGAVIGYLVTPGLLFFMPQRERIDAAAVRNSRKVTIFRRLCGLAVDVLLTGLVLGGIDVFLMVAFPQASVDWKVSATADFTLFFVFQWACAVLSHGYTPGKRLCRLRVVALDDQPPTFYHLSLRYVLIWGQLGGFIQLAGVIYDLGDTLGSEMYFLGVAAALAGVGLWLYFFWELLTHFFSRHSGRPFWYERLSKTHSVSVYPVAAEK